MVIVLSLLNPICISRVSNTVRSTIGGHQTKEMALIFVHVWTGTCRHVVQLVDEDPHLGGHAGPQFFGRIDDLRISSDTP